MHSVAGYRRAFARQRYHFISDLAGGLLASALTEALGKKKKKGEGREDGIK